MKLQLTQCWLLLYTHIARPGLSSPYPLCAAPYQLTVETGAALYPKHSLSYQRPINSLSNWFYKPIISLPFLPFIRHYTIVIVQ